MDSFQNENDQKLLELLQKSETSDKEIIGKTILVKPTEELVDEEIDELVDVELESDED